MQGSQKEEERNLESHNRITLSEVISLNLTICRVMGEKMASERKRHSERKGREMRWEHLQSERQKKEKRYIQ